VFVPGKLFKDSLIFAGVANIITIQMSTDSYSTLRVSGHDTKIKTAGYFPDLSDDEKKKEISKTSLSIPTIILKE
jgi:hypothetical protein